MQRERQKEQERRERKQRQEGCAAEVLKRVSEVGAQPKNLEMGPKLYSKQGTQPKCLKIDSKSGGATEES